MLFLLLLCTAGRAVVYTRGSSLTSIPLLLSLVKVISNKTLLTITTLRCNQCNDGDGGGWRFEQIRQYEITIPETLFFFFFRKCVVTIVLDFKYARRCDGVLIILVSDPLRKGE